MADDEQDKSQKTEQPSQKRLEEAFRKGQVTTSREVNTFLLMLTLALILTWMIPSIYQNAKVALLPFLQDADQIPMDAGGLGQRLTHTVKDMLGLMAVPLILTVVAAIAAGLMQHGVVFSVEPIMPSWSKISLRKGIDRLFSLRSVTEFIKGVLKITIVAVVAYIVIMPEIGHVRQLPDDDMRGMLFFLALLITRVMIGVCIALFFIALLDFVYQRYEYLKSLRMSKQEVKDEYKQQEGDPIIKQRLRMMRMERARKRMMAAVPKADVVITNPTHFAIALVYDNTCLAAPRVVAKGQDLVALNIRRVAEENNVPVVENPPLAQALFASTKLDEEIPLIHYKAVAEIIAYVYRLKGKTVMR